MLLLTPNGKTSALKFLAHILERIFYLSCDRGPVTSECRVFFQKTFNLADGAGHEGAQVFNQFQITNIILMQTYISLTVTTG